MTDLAVPIPAGTRAARTNLTLHLPALCEALQQQRRFRIEQLAEMADGGAGAVVIPADPRAQVAQALRAGAAVALADAETALHRMATGTYGRCRRCDAAIPLERLEILPSATLCMTCQGGQEVDGG
jgi:DnaK suppressor protein